MREWRRMEKGRVERGKDFCYLKKSHISKIKCYKLIIKTFSLASKWFLSFTCLGFLFHDVSNCLICNKFGKQPEMGGRGVWKRSPKLSKTWAGWKKFCFVLFFGYSTHLPDQNLPVVWLLLGNEMHKKILTPSAY